MKKFLAIVTALLMVLSMASFASAEEAITKENIKIGFVHISDPSDMGYTYNHDLGTQAMVEALGLSEDQIINKFNVPETAACEVAIKELIEAGCNMIFCTSFGHADYAIAAAKEHPEIEFMHATGFQASLENLPNYHNYFAAIYQARYLSGIAAGLKTTANKVGYVAAHPFAEVISGYSAFYLGAKSVNPDVEMLVMYTNSWNDPTKEAQVAKALIDQGCDVISQHCDSTAPATTAEAAGVFQVGYNSDMREAAPKASLTSARIDWSRYLIYAVEQRLAGEPIATDWSQGLSEGAVYLSDLNEDIVAEGTAEAIEAATQAIIAGELNVFAGPLNDSEGNEVVAEGDYYAEQESESAPSWDKVLEGVTVIQG